MSRSGTKDRGAGSPTHLRGGRESSAFCPGSPRHLTDRPCEVTCRRCLASIAKLDRGFRRKARRHFARYGKDRGNLWNAHNVSRAAVAREEGRRCAIHGCECAIDRLEGITGHAIAREEGRTP